MQRISIDGGTLAYADEGSGHAVVLIHGFPLDHTIWDAVTPHLAANARVLRPDLRGLGASSVSAGPYLMETLAADVAALLDAHSIERATIVGHSLGGFVALAFFRMFRERVTGLGLVASRASAETPELAAGREELAQKAESEGMAPIVERYIPRLFGPSVYAGDPALVARTKGLIERADPRGAAALLRGMAMRVDSRDLLEEIDVPFILVAGDADQLGNLGEAKVTARTVPGGVFECLEGCGHLPMLEAPRRLCAVLDPFAGAVR